MTARTDKHPLRRAPTFPSIVLALALAACGGGGEGPEEIPDDDPLSRRDSPSGRRSSPQQEEASSPAGDGEEGGEPGMFASYDKVDEDLRQELTREDFRADPTGTRNRDPFQSYVVAQPGVPTGHQSEEARDRTEVCDETNSVAVEYSLRDLELIGIVMRGTKSYALFRDGQGHGHIINRNECLGSEQAVVRSIGAGYVRLETLAEAPQGTETSSAGQKREILLHPEEYELPPEEALEE